MAVGNRTSRLAASIRDPASDCLVSGRPLDGVRVVELERRTDARGAFTEVFCSHWDSGVDPTQWSLVESDTGVLRGMHVHQRHDEYFLLVRGHVSVGLYDLRSGSSTYGRSSLYEFSSPTRFLSFPRGILHGWLFHEPSIHLQAVSESYVDYGSDDNNGCSWSDPGLGIEWPFVPTTISARAARFPSLSDLESKLNL